MTEPGEAPPDAALSEAGRVRPSIAKNLANLMSSQLITWAMATALSVVLPRFLDPSSLGQLSLAGSIWAMAALFIGLGTSINLTVEMARDESLAQQTVGPIILLRVIAFAVVSSLIAVVGLLAGFDQELSVILLLVGIATGLSISSDVFIAALTGLEEMAFPARAAIVSKVAYTVTLLAVLFAGGRVVAIAAVGIVPAAVGVVVLVREYGRFAPVTLAGWKGMSRRILKASRVFLAAGAALTVYQQIDNVVMALLVDREALGWYSTADGLFSSLLFIPSILMISVFPRMSRLHEEDPSALDALIRQTFSTIMLCGLPIGLGTVVVSRDFAPLLFGNDYRESGPVLLIFGLVVIIVFVTILLGGVARATNQQRLWVYVMVGAIALSIPLDIVLVPWADDRFGNGAIGGALAYLVTESFMLVIGVWKVAPNLIDGPTVARIAKILVSGGVMFSATWPLQHVLFVVPAAVGVVVYASMIALTRALSEDERAIMGKALRRFRRVV